MPPETSVRFALDVMRGAERAATRYGAVIAGGDTKQNPKFAMVVTAFGTVDREHRLTRSRATPGDLLVVTGHLGSMLLGTIVFRNKVKCSTACRAALERALIEQRPPHELARKLVDARLANACIDISDGLSAALFSMCAASGVGAVIDECRIPVHPDLQDLVRSLGLRPMQIALAGGDWQYLYALSPDELPAAQRLADSLGTPLTVLGQVVASNTVAVRTTEGPFRHLLRIGHDSFGDGRHGIGYFERLQQPQVCFGDEISLETLGPELQVPVSK